MKFAVGIRKRRQVKTGYKRKPQKREWVKDKEPTTKDYDLLLEEGSLV